MLAGVWVFDLTTGSQVTTFAGPTGQLSAAGPYLFAAAPDDLQVWDAMTGERTGTIHGFVPASHHRAAGELAAVTGSHFRRWTTPK